MLRPLLALLLPLAAQAGPAVAQVAADQRLPCSDYAAIKRQLGTSYGEAPVGAGLQTDGRLLQIFASPRSGSWTIVSTTPLGLACVLAAGRGWETLPDALADPSI